MDKGKILQKQVKGEKIIYSYHGLASSALLRKSTINDTLNGNTFPKTSTLISIIQAMNFSITDFGQVFDNISEHDVYRYNEIHKIFS